MNIIKKYLARVKRKLLKKPFIEDPNYPPFWMNKLLGNQNALLIQIGSNDGKTGDPFYPLLQINKQWKALFVEPVPYAFEKLKNNYPDTTRFRFENVAINHGESLTFYWVDAKAQENLPDLPYWFDQLGSFDKQHIIKHFEGKLEPYIISKKLEGITLPTLLNRNNIKAIDLLHIDTEGYDWNILSQLDFREYTPKFILFEHNHLSTDALKSAYDFLANRYFLFKSGIDILAVYRHLPPAFLQAFLKSNWKKMEWTISGPPHH